MTWIGSGFEVINISCFSQTCWAGDPDTPVVPLRTPVLPEVPAPESPLAPRVPPRSPVSLYDACVLMSGVRDARVAACMRRYQKTMTWCIGDLVGHVLYKVVNIIQEHIITLSIHFLLSYRIIFKCNQQLTIYFKDTPNPVLFYLIYI